MASGGSRSVESGSESSSDEGRYELDMDCASMPNEYGAKCE